MTPRLMVLGGGRHQLSLVRRARRRDLDVVLVDYYQDPPARALATTHLQSSTLDVDEVVAAARTHQVDGVVTTGTDLPVVTMAAVADALDLPAWIDPAGAELATNKGLMRPALAGAGVRMAAQCSIGSRDGTDVAGLPPLPVVVKPADSQGQRGVSRVDQPGNLGPAVADARRHSRVGTVVVEEFLHGPEVTANAWVEGDRIALLAVNDRVTINPPPHVGIAHRHVHPSRHVDRPMLDVLGDTLVRIADVYGMTTGPLYVQFILTADGPVVVEAAARVGGGHETSLFPLVCGSSAEDRLIDLALTGRCQPWDHDVRSAVGPPASVTFVLGRRGTVAAIDPMPMLAGTTEGGWYVDVGDQLEDLTTSLGRIGYFVTTADTREELDRRATAQYDALAVTGTHGESLVRHPEPALLLQ